MATVSNRALCALGPIKMEVVYLTSLTDQDTFTTLMQRPIFALCSETNTNAASTAQAAVTADTKTVTVHDPTTGGGNGKVAVAVFGF